MNPSRGRQCPHCGKKSLIIRGSSEADTHGLLRHEYHLCRNILCGVTIAGTRELLREISPPRVRNPAVNLPAADAETLKKVRIEFFSKDEAQEELDLGE